MTRGNQRDKDREKAQKKAAANAKKPKQSANSLAQSREANAEIMRKKNEVLLIEALKRKAEQAAGGGTAKT